MRVWSEVCVFGSGDPLPDSIIKNDLKIWKYLCRRTKLTEWVQTALLWKSKAKIETGVFNGLGRLTKMRKQFESIMPSKFQTACCAFCIWKPTNKTLKKL